MTRELDEQCARAMGWELRHVDWQDYYYMPDRNAMMPITEFEPSTDPAAAHLLEEEIERRDLQFTYVTYLNEIVNPLHASMSRKTWVFSGHDLFMLLRATPEQRARAFIAATQLQ